MANYTPDKSESRFPQVVTPGAMVSWNPYPQYVTDAELASFLAGFTPGGSESPTTVPGQLRVLTDTDGVPYVTP